MRGVLTFAARRANLAEMRVIEAVIASTIMLATMSFLITAKTWLPSSDSRALAWNALCHLDEKELLGGYVFGARWGELKHAVEEVLPRGCAYRLTVLSEGGDAIAIVESGSLGRTFGEVRYEVRGGEVRYVALQVSI